MRSILYLSTFLLAVPSAFANNSLNWWQQNGDQWSVSQERKTGMPYTLYERTKLIAHVAKVEGQNSLWFTAPNCRSTSSRPIQLAWKLNGVEIDLEKRCKDGVLQITPSSNSENQKVIGLFESNHFVTVSGTESRSHIIGAKQSITFSSNNLSYALSTF